MHGNRLVSNVIADDGARSHGAFWLGVIQDEWLTVRVEDTIVDVRLVVNAPFFLRFVLP